MTVSSTTSRVVFAGNGATTSFPFGFKVATATELSVIYTDAVGDDHVLATGQYTVTGLGSDSGGAVTYAPDGAPIASGTRLTIYRDVPLIQPTSINNQGAMWPSVIEGALDRLTWIAQKLADTLGRSLVVSPTDSAALASLPDATTRANAVLGFDGNGQPFAATLDSSVVAWSSWVTSNWRTIASASAGRALLSAVGLTGNEAIAGNKTLSGTTDMSGGRALVPTRPSGDSGTDAASTAFVQARVTGLLGGAVLRSWLAGLGMANSGTSPNTEIDVSAGACADDTNAAMLVLSARTLDCATVGPNGLDAGSLAATTWYHVFAIGKTDGTTAVLASTSLASPTLPAAYTLKRRIGSFRTDGSTFIRDFVQDGDLFQWATPTPDYIQTNPGSTAILVTVSAPPGLRTQAHLQVVVEQSATSAQVFTLLSDPSVLDIAATSNRSDLSPAGNNGGTSWYVAGRADVMTDTSARVRARLSASDANTNLQINLLGWTDRRGKDA